MDEEVGGARAAPVLGSQVSCLRREVTAHSAGLGVLQGAGLARLAWAGAGDCLPPGGKVADQAGPVASSLGVGRRSLPSPFCGCFLPLTRLLLMHFLGPNICLPLAPHGAVCLNQCMFRSPTLLNAAGVLHVKSQGQVDAHSGRVTSPPKLLQAVKPTQPRRGHGGHFSNSQAHWVRGACRKVAGGLRSLGLF